MSLIRLLFNMQRRCRGTYLSTNRMVQRKTGKQHGDNCRRCEHVPVNQPSPVKKTSCVRCEKLQGVWGLRSLGECMKDHRWQWRSCWVHSSGANQTCRFQEKKMSDHNIFPLLDTVCTSPLHDVCGHGGENHLCRETTWRLNVSPQTGGGNSWILSRKHF